ncbi:MAG: DNA polymerase III subunit gamma/tau [Maricaulaceae bacterium]
MSESSTLESYQVLARKYRPQTFEDMIGQEAMVTTLTNAFKAGRVAHAFMLTGVRGIGKTTTARLLARALNYKRDGVDGPSVELGTPGEHCGSIMASSHMDVLEMDAASRTGVENMRELLDGVRYAPVNARYKVYIIDEVHMLSTGAFNALLKTLEEPPDHAKFIFATTEIRKVPITVLSRCQRFDLRRVDADALALHLRGIADKEAAKISDEGLALIARAAEGSVRDSLSLLDQAIVQAGQDDGEVSGFDIRNMLGLADRVRVLDLFSHAAKGDGASALMEMRSQYDDGADPAIVMRDLLDVCHDVTRAQALGDKASFDAAPDAAARMLELGQALSAGQLTRMWQLLLKSYHDVRQAPVPLAAAEMALLSLSVAGQLPPPETAAALIKALNDGSVNLGSTGGPQTMPSAPSGGSASGYQSAPPTQPPNQPSLSAPQAPTMMSAGMSPQPTAALSPPQPTQAGQAAIQINSLEDMIAHIKSIDLKYDIEKFVRLIRIAPGSMTIAKLVDAPPTLVGRMVEILRDLTGDLWLIDQEAHEAVHETIAEKRVREVAEQKERDYSHPAFSHPLLAQAQLIEIRDIAPISDGNSNVIQGDFGETE